MASSLQDTSQKPSSTQFIISEDLENAEKLRSLLQRRQASLFVGAGIGIAYGYPPWRTLLLELAGQLGRNRAPIELIAKLNSPPSSRGGRGLNFEKAGQQIEEALGTQFFQDAIDRTFDVRNSRRPNCTGPTALEVISRFQCGPFFTTNFDALLENEVAKSRQVSSSDGIALWEQFDPVLDALEEANSTKVVKLHGTYNDRNGRVLTKHEYEDAYSSRDRLVARLLRHLFCSRTVLFVGCSLQKDRTLEILKETTEFNPARRHFALALEGEETAGLLSYWLDLGIRPIRLRRASDGDPYAHLPAVLADLGDEGNTVEVQTHPSLLALVRIPSESSADGFTLARLLQSARNSNCQLERELWEPLMQGSILNSAHCEEPADKVIAFSTRWLRRGLAPLPQVVESASSLLHAIEDAMRTSGLNGLKVCFGFGSMIRLQGGRVLGPMAVSAFQALERTKSISEPTDSYVPLVFEVQRVDKEAATDINLPGFAVYDPVAASTRALVLQTAASATNPNSSVALEFTAVCLQRASSPRLLQARCMFPTFPKNGQEIDLVEPLRRARRPGFDLSHFEGLFGVVGQPGTLPDLRLKSKPEGGFALKVNGEFWLREGAAKSKKELDLDNGEKARQLFTKGLTESWQIKIQFSDSGELREVVLVSNRESLPANNLFPWNLDLDACGKNKIVFVSGS